MYSLSFRILKKRHLTAFLSMIFSLFVIFSLTGCGEAKDAETLISEAKEYQKNGDNNAAIIQLKNALQQEPNHKTARFMLGVLLQQNKDLLAAEKELERALEFGAEVETVLPVLAKVQFDLGKFQQLLDTVGRYPDNNLVEVKVLYGKALLATGKLEESKVLLDQLLAENPDATEVLIGLAQLALSDKDLDSANQLANQAIEKNPNDSSAWLFQARLLQAQNKAEQALEAFEKVIQLTPDNISAYNSKASIEINLQQFEEAKKSIERARQIAPDSLMLYHIQALLDFRQGSSAEALESIQTVLSAAPEHLPSVLLAGEIQLSLGSFSQAEQYLEQYLKRIPNNLYARKLMIETLLRSNQTKKALAILEPTLSESVQDAQLLALAGEVYMRSGDFTKATEFYEKADELIPNNASIHMALGLNRLAMGDREHGIEELELASSLDTNSPRAGLLLILAHLRDNAPDKALSVINEQMKKDAQNPLFHNLKGVALLSKDDVGKARESFNQAVALQPDYFPALSNLTRLDIQDQKPEIAKNRFEAILKKDDKNIKAMSALANLALIQGKKDEATRWMELASNKNPNELEPMLQLTAHYLRVGENEKALLLARRLNGTYPNEPRVLEILGRVQLAHENLTAALDSFERLAARLPEAPAAHLQIAAIHMNLKDYTAANAALRRALFVNPDYVDAKVLLVRIAVLENKMEDAQTLSRKIQNDHADIPLGYELEGDIWVKQKKPELAVKVYEKAFEITQNGSLITKIHSALNQTGDAKNANAKITQWLQENPDDAATRLYLANDYLSKKQYANATKEYEIILQKNPQHVMSLNNLAWLYQQNKNPRALEYAEKASQLAPQIPAVQDTFAWILVEKGELERALPILERAASQLTENGTVQYHYAYALAKVGKQAQASQILGRITAANANFPEIEDARSLLKQIQ